MKKGKIVLQGKKVFGLFLVCCLVMSTVIGYDVGSIEVKADNVFDHAVDWEPLKVMDLERDVYYRITLTESDEIHFFEGYKYGYKRAEIELSLYMADGTEIKGNLLEAGVYYCKGKDKKVWYTLNKEYDTTDLTKDSNINGTIFEGYTKWEPMTTITHDDDPSSWEYGFSDIYKIELSQRMRLEFRSDDGPDSSGYEQVCVLYDRFGRRLGENWFSIASLLEKYGVEWDAGVYFIEIKCQYKNLYYVLSAPQNATGITISSNKVSLAVGETKELTSQIEPSNCVDTVSWKSTDTNVATVKNDGTITGVAAGTCIVQATTGSGKAALCEVTVTDSKSDSASKTKKTIKLSSVKIKRGSKKITGKVSVQYATVKIKMGSGKYKKAKVKGKNFILKTSKLKKGKKITIKVAKSGYQSLTKKYKVK